MDVAKILSAIDSGYSTLAGSLLLPKETGLASTLTLGQTLKGKVLMRHEQDRYTVLFAEKTHTVHSEIKLALNEIIETKVVAIRQDFIHLKRVTRQMAGLEQPPNNKLPDGFVHEIANDYKIPLTEGDVALVQRVGRQGNQAHLIATAKILLFFKKVGLTPTKEILEQLVKLFIVQGPVSLTNSEIGEDLQEAGAIATQSDSSAGARNNWLQALPAELKELIRGNFQTASEENTARIGVIGANRSGNASVRIDRRETDGAKNQTENGHADKLPLFNLLNVQNETRLAHRYQSIAFLFDDQLIEVDLAIFSPRNGSEGTAEKFHYARNGDSAGDQANISGSATTSHRLTFALETRSLGRVAVQVNTINKRLKLEFMLSSENIVEQFMTFAHTLEDQFDHYGWCMDEAKYVAEKSDISSMSLAKRAVVEQHILAGSLSRLF